MTALLDPEPPQAEPTQKKPIPRYRRGGMIVLLVIVGIPLLMWGYSSWRKSHEERILAGIVAKGGQFTRSTTPFQQWVSQFAFLGLRLKFEGVLNDFSIPEPTDEELAYVAGKRSTVGGLAILDSKIDDRLLKTLSKLPNLRRLVLFSCSVGDPELEQIIDRLPHPEKLGVLNLKGTTLTDRGLAPLRKLSGLNVLIVDQSAIDGSGVLNLPANQMVCLGLMNSRLNDAQLLSMIKRWKNTLKTLDLVNSRISDEGMQPLTSLPLLRNLRFGGTSITPSGVRLFLARRSQMNLPDIEQVSLAGFPWTIEDLKKISLPASLQELDLTGWAIHDADIDQLPNIEKLQTLNLSRTGITDAGLPALKGFPQLRSLHLRGTRVTNTGLKVALEHARINSLAVGESQITFEGLMTYSGSWSRATIDVSGMDLTLEQLRLLAEQRLPWREVIDRDRIFTRH